MSAARSITQAPGELSVFSRIVVPIQGSDREYLVQEQAVLLAAAIGIPVVGIHVRDGEEERSDDMFEWVRGEANRFNVQMQGITLDGSDPAEVILEELGIRDLVVIGSARIGGQYQVSSIAQRLVHDAPCPVQIIRLPA
jgi:nucleotide-binding universal stress UspA family protein